MGSNLARWLCRELKFHGTSPVEAQSWASNSAQRRLKGFRGRHEGGVRTGWGEGMACGREPCPSSPSNEYLGLISFRMDWLDLLAVQGSLKSFLQKHSSKASILQCSAYFMAQLSHPYMTTGKNTALTRWTFVSKVMSLLFNMLSRLVITFLPRSKCLLISWLQSPSAVILEPRK